MISTTVDLGNIITLVGILVTLVTFGASIKASVRNLETRVDQVSIKLEDQNKILLQMARYEGRLDLLEQRLEFILDYRPTQVVKLPAGER